MGALLSFATTMSVLAPQGSFEGLALKARKAGTCSRGSLPITLITSAATLSLAQAPNID